MQIEFDSDKRHKTLTERGLDLARAGEVFAGVTVTAEDARFDYNEPRFKSGVGTSESGGKGNQRIRAADRSGCSTVPLLIYRGRPASIHRCVMPRARL